MTSVLESQLTSNVFIYVVIKTSRYKEDPHDRYHHANDMLKAMK
jgi:hypothetical protein